MVGAESTGPFDELFLEALDLSEVQRRRYLDTHCGDDPALRSRVERMLREHDKAAEFFEDLEASLFGGLRDRPFQLLDPYDLVGEEVGHYHILEVIGRGGMGVVYRAVDMQLQRQVALKFLPPNLKRDEAAGERFRREARAASALDHPNVCPVHEIGEHEGRLYIAMAFCEGETLKDRLNKGPLSIHAAVDLARQLAAGLAFAHKNGVIHRDVKPGNVLIDGQGRVRLVDFGLAKLSDQTQVTTTAGILGTVAYMSPEQITGSRVDARADVWSAGVVLYEMLAGLRPYTAEQDATILYKIVHETHRPLSTAQPRVSPRLQQIVDRCLAKNPAQRFSDGGALLKALEEPSVAEPGVAVTGDASPRVARLSPLHATVAAAAALLLIVVGYLFWNAFEAPSRTQYSAAEVSRVAMLPLETEGYDADARAVFEGITASVSRQLERWQGQGPDGYRFVPIADVHRNEVGSPHEARQVLSADLTANLAVRRTDAGHQVIVMLRRTRNGRIVHSDTLHFDDLELRDMQAGVTSVLAGFLGAPPDAGATGLLRTFDAASEDALEYYLRGMALLDRPDRETDIERAAGNFKAALAEDPDFARAYEGLCEAFWYAYEHTRDQMAADAALSNCRRALDEEPLLTRAALTEALILDGTGRYDEALAVTERLLEAEREHSEVHRIHGRVLAHLGRNGEAENALLHAVALDNRSWKAYSTLGNFYLRNARYDEALSAFRQITTFAEDYLWGYVNLGAAQLNLGRLEEARETWERARALRSDYDVLSNLATTLFLEREFEQAAQMYEEALQLDDRKYALWGNYASACFWAPDRRDDAISAYEKAADLARIELAARPRDPMLLLNLASYEAHLDRQEQAAERIEKAIQLAETNPFLMFAAADAYEQLGERDRALEWLEKAMEAGFPRFWIEDNVWFDALREDPRYQDIVPDSE